MNESQTSTPSEPEALTPQEAAGVIYGDLAIYSFADRKKIIAGLNRLQRESIEAEASRAQQEAAAYVQQLQDLID